MANNTIDISFASGRKILPFVEELAALRIEIFREFPYLYQGDTHYEKTYLHVYTQSPSSLLVLARHNGALVGASTCLPMEDEDVAFQRPFLERNMDLKKIFYFGESILKKEHRGKGLGHVFFEEREKHAKELIPELDLTVFCSVIRPDYHPSKPSDYRPHDAFWNKRGYQKQEGMICSFPWRDIGDTMESHKNLQFWSKFW